MTTALIVGTLLALAGLAFVLYPLFDDAPLAGSRFAAPRARPDAEEPHEDAVAALREIEFDRATGKLSDDDYTSLRARYTEVALGDMRARDSAVAMAATPARDGADTVQLDDADTAVDPVEAAVRRQRERLVECAACGPRPEVDALYCSDCGRYLPERCGGCGAAITEAGARFCGDCGASLAA